MLARSRLLIKVFFKENQDIKTTSGWTVSPHWTHLGMKPEPDPRLLSSSTTIPHNHSYLAHYGSYRSVPQLPEAPAFGHFGTSDGVLLATCSSSLRKEANTQRYHTDAKKGVAFFTHSEVGMAEAGGMAAATTTVPSLHSKGTAKIRCYLPQRGRKPMHPKTKSDVAYFNGQPPLSLLAGLWLRRLVTLVSL